MPIDIECEARWLLRDFDRPPGAERFAERHLGPDPIIYILGLKGRDAETRPINGRWRICVRSGLRTRDPILFRWIVIHETCEHHITTKLDYRGEDAELVAESLTAACAMGRDDFRRAAALLGEEPSRLGPAFRVSETAAALRIGEVVRPAAVVAPETVRTRTPPDEEFAWDDEQGMRRAARDGRPGLRRVTLGDQKRRTALIAAL